MEDPTSYSNNQRSNIMQAVTAEVGAALVIEGERKAGRRGVDVHWNLPYKSMFSSAAAGIKPLVTVEPTVMGGQNPQAHATLSPRSESSPRPSTALTASLPAAIATVAFYVLYRLPKTTSSHPKSWAGPSTSPASSLWLRLSSAAPCSESSAR